MLDSVFVDGYWEINLGDDLFLGQVQNVGVN